MLERAYIEITNVCGQNCSFCPGCSRPPKAMAVAEFALYARKLRPFTDCFCLHVMGEPLTHPDLDAILSVCDGMGVRVILTTNGRLLKARGEILTAHPSVYKIQISLHSFEANEQKDNCYFDDCFSFASKASAKGVICILRLWNRDGREKGENALNDAILARMKAALPGFWRKNKRGFCISEKLYVEFDERFVWPSEGGEILSRGGFCRAITKQIAVLSNGTVVPCCLDGQGSMPLGDLKSEELTDILMSERAAGMARAFGERADFYMPFCRTCGYADRFNGAPKNKKNTARTGHEQ